MTVENGDDFSPKTRDDWVSLFSDGFKKANYDLQSEREEAEAKKAADEAAQSNDATGKGGGSDTPKRTKRSFGERLLGL